MFMAYKKVKLELSHVMPNPLYDKLFLPHEEQNSPFLYLSKGEMVTHKGFLQMAGRFANILSGLGLVIGDRLAVQVEKSEYGLAIYAACAQMGVIYLPLNTAYTPQELYYFIENSDASMFICETSREELLQPLVKSLGIRLATIDVLGNGSLQKALSTANDKFEPVNREPNDIAAILYTSGTTGRSKGAMISHQNLISNAQTLASLWHFTQSDILLHALPIFHTHGLFVATNVMLVSGGSMIFLPKFDLDAVFKNLPLATSMMGVPTFYTRLLSDGRLTKANTSHIRLFISGSAPLLDETHRMFEKQTGQAILERYGMTETNMNTSNPYKGERRPGTVGLPLPNVDLKITDTVTGELVPDGEIGQIEVRGPNVFQGYWDMPEKTSEELREDGFFITGDLGRKDEEGYISIVGRNKDLIISGGYNIYPKEIEKFLDEQPGIAESAVVGISHPDFGESPVGFLVIKPGFFPDLEEIKNAISNHFARFKHPRKLMILNELPRNTMGKVQKNVLRETYCQLFQKF